MLKKIAIQGEIGTEEGQVSAAWFKSQLPANGTDPIEVSIHSEGGSVIEGFSIYDAIQNYAGPKKCIVASAAFSIASFIPMAFDDVEITPNGYLMLHNPYAACEGDSAEFAKMASVLDGMKTNMVSAYAAKTGKSADEIKAILDVETYLNASTALANGFVNRITPSPVMGRLFAKAKSLPHGIFQALFNVGPSGDNREPTKEKTMSESQKPVAATVTEIKRKFPKAKADFIVKCMEKEMPMEEVAVAVVDETMAENETLMARISALETEMAAMKAAVPTEPLPTLQPEIETEMEYARAKATGVKPVAKAKAACAMSAKAKWDLAISSALKSGVPRAKAVTQVDIENPGLRQEMLDEVNAR
jgi:ATP-dependent protease ClpP protease subunit